MIVLTETTDKVEVKLGVAHTSNALQCYSCYREITTTTYVPGRTIIDTNGTNDVIVVPVPNTSSQKIVDFISVYNADTILHNVTVKIDANGTEKILWKGDVAVGAADSRD